MKYLEADLKTGDKLTMDVTVGCVVYKACGVISGIRTRLGAERDYLTYSVTVDVEPNSGAEYLKIDVLE